MDKMRRLISNSSGKRNKKVIYSKCNKCGKRFENKWYKPLMGIFDIRVISTYKEDNIFLCENCLEKLSKWLKSDME